MANRKKEMYKPKPMAEGKRNVIQGLLQEYDTETADDIQDALKDLPQRTELPERDKAETRPQQANISIKPYYEMILIKELKYID